MSLIPKNSCKGGANVSFQYIQVNLNLRNEFLKLTIFYLFLQYLEVGAHGLSGPNVTPNVDAEFKNGLEPATIRLQSIMDPDAKVQQ